MEFSSDLLLWKVFYMNSMNYDVFGRTIIKLRIKFYNLMRNPREIHAIFMYKLYHISNPDLFRWIDTTDNTCEFISQQKAYSLT